MATTIKFAVLALLCAIVAFGGLAIASASSAQGQETGDQSGLNQRCAKHGARDNLALDTQADDCFKGGRGDDAAHFDRYAGDVDFAAGNRGADYLNVDDEDGRDLVNGGPGNDACYVDAAMEAVGCEAVYVNGELVE